MASLAELELQQFDYFDESLRGERFHETMERLSEQGWLAQGPHGYIVLDRESAEFFLRCKAAIFPGMQIADIFGVTEGPLYEQFKHNIIDVNGADHQRLRSLVNPALAPRAVERYRPVMREFLEGLLKQATCSTAVASRGAAQRHDGDGPQQGDAAAAGETVTCDFVEAFAKPYPSLAIAYVMGAPLEDAQRLHWWSNMIQRQFDVVSMARERELIEAAVEEFYEYARDLVRARREDPSDELISKLIDAEQEGDRLSEEECINLVFNVLVGGVDTSQSQLAHAVRLLAEHKDQLALLTADPELADQAVEEALRYEPITPFTARVLTEEVTWRDVTFPKDTILSVCAFTGNRDLEPDEQGEAGPHAFDITADRGRARPLTFGAGVHYCLGANLARVELQEGLRFVAEKMPELELDGEPEYGAITGIYGLERLPIRFRAATA